MLSTGTVNVLHAGAMIVPFSGAVNVLFTGAILVLDTMNVPFNGAVNVSTTGAMSAINWCYQCAWSNMAVQAAGSPHIPFRTREMVVEPCLLKCSSPPLPAMLAPPQISAPNICTKYLPSCKPMAPRTACPTAPWAVPPSMLALPQISVPNISPGVPPWLHGLPALLHHGKWLTQCHGSVRGGIQVSATAGRGLMPRQLD